MAEQEAASLGGLFHSGFKNSFRAVNKDQGGVSGSGADHVQEWSILVEGFMFIGITAMIGL